jgi:tetratricopeptide (TPR) repeat protein
MTQIYMRELNGSTNRKDTEDQKNLPQDGAENFERDLDESLAFQIVEAFYFIDVANFDSAIHNCNRVLELDDANVPALRCLATAHWLKGARDEALDVFERALSLDGGKNPYLLRSFSVSSGLSGDHDRALALMTAATEVSPLNPLAWRARGIMSYLYSGDRDSCLDFLSKAYELSGGIDMEAMRFKGQVLMEHGRFSEALSTLRLALHVAPGDPMTLASMATCIAAIQDKDMASVRFPPNYVLKLQLMDDLTLFEFCEDPEELFEAAIFPNLVATVSENQARKFTNYVRSDGASMKGGWGSIKAMQKAGQKQQSDVSNSVDAPPDILFRYGLYCLHRGIQLHSKEYTSKAKNLFMR